MNLNPTQSFDILLDYLKRSRGFDFTGYKRASLQRRINKRMQGVNIGSYNDYLDYLEVHPEEFTQLFNGILINVTSFFRDLEAWQTLQDEVLPRILEARPPDLPVRVWSAGCASGEEAYTIAIILAEALGDEEFHKRVKIYATDLDDEALARARLALYTEREIENVPAHYREKYFERQGNRSAFRKDLRRSVIFGRHDLIQDAPISRVDLLVCRNLLMYFNAETQAKVLARLHFALNDMGFLFLGRAEMLLTHPNLFTPFDLKCRIFTRVPKINLRDRLLVMAQSGSEDAANNLVSMVRTRDLVFENGPMAQLVVDDEGNLQMANERVRTMFGINPRDLGRPFQDLQISYRPVELRSSMDRASETRETVVLNDIQWINNGGDARELQVHVIPLVNNSNGNGLLGVNIMFIDVTSQKQMQERIEHSNQELETALEELQSTNEELETTNEELQSTIEELETTNEELQSTNEELETMNEELQSTNEELETMNEEMRVRTDELNHINSFMESILTSLHGGVVVLDNEMRVQVWNRRSEDLWGLRADEVEGANFLSLDIGLPVEQLKKFIRAVLAGESGIQDVVLKATNRRGRIISCRITCTTLYSPDHVIQGAIIVMQDVSESFEYKPLEE